MGLQSYEVRPPPILTPPQALKPCLASSLDQHKTLTVCGVPTALLCPYMVRGRAWGVVWGDRLSLWLVHFLLMPGRHTLSWCTPRTNISRRGRISQSFM